MPVVGENIYRLKASDRNSTDQNAINKINNPSGSTQAKPVKVYQEDSIPEWDIATRSRIQEEAAEDYQRIKAAQAAKEYKYQGSSLVQKTKDIALKVSPYAAKYADHLSFNDDEWKELGIQYQADKNTYGEGRATQNLNQKIKDNVSKNQTFLEKSSNTAVMIVNDIEPIGIIVLFALLVAVFYAIIKTKL